MKAMIASCRGTIDMKSQLTVVFKGQAIPEGISNGMDQIQIQRKSDMFLAHFTNRMQTELTAVSTQNGELALWPSQTNICHCRSFSRYFVAM